MEDLVSYDEPCFVLRVAIGLIGPYDSQALESQRLTGTRLPGPEREVVLRYKGCPADGDRSGSVGAAFDQAPPQGHQVGSIEQVKQGNGPHRIAGQL